MGIGWIFAKGLKILLNLPALHSCKIDRHAYICSQSELTKCNVGRYSYIGYHCFMVNTDIGKFCSIADRVCIGGAIHPMHFVSTSPVFHEGENALHTHFSNHQVDDTPITKIGNDVWIGQGAYVKAGVSISNGAVVGMGAVVTKDIGPYEIWAGNPARLIRNRFDKITIDRLLKSQWWQMDDKELSKYARFFNDPSVFLNEYENFE